MWGHSGKWAGTGGDKGKEQDLRKTREEWRGGVRVSRSFWGGGQCKGLDQNTVRNQCFKKGHCEESRCASTEIMLSIRRSDRREAGRMLGGLRKPGEESCKGWWQLGLGRRDVDRERYL